MSKDLTIFLRMVMRMNKTCYKQYDTRWGSLPYPRRPWYIRNCGCGEVSICNSIIEMASKASQTPKTIQPYMKQFAESRGNGTYHYGIPTAMKHYGLTEVAEHATMKKLWEQLRKGGRVAILLMGSRNAGSKKVHWTGSGHFVAVTAYKEEGGKHWVYVKDSASTSSLRNGWMTYEGNIRNACLKCWSGKLNGEVAKTPAPTVTPTADGKLTIDGIGGPSTVKAMQRFFGTPQDGIIGGQNQSYSKWYPALKSVKYGKGGSPCVRKLQEWLGTSIDGIWGKKTSKALQSKLGVTDDGIFGKGSMKAWQKYLNAHDKAVYPTPTPKPVPTPSSDPLKPWYDAMKTQYKWSKNQVYKWVTPTIKSSKSKGTCITFPAVSLQRLGLIPSGTYFYFDPKTKQITGKAASIVKKGDKFSLSYPNKTAKALWKEGKLKKGDIIGFGNPYYHTMVFMGMKNGKPIYNTMGSKRGLGIRYPLYASRKINMIVRLKKVK